MNNDIQCLDETIIKKLRSSLYFIERANIHKTEPKKDPEMVKEFMKTIENIVKQEGGE